MCVCRYTVIVDKKRLKKLKIKTPEEFVRFFNIVFGVFYYYL